jgi:hypothetical protein
VYQSFQESPLSAECENACRLYNQAYACRHGTTVEHAVIACDQRILKEMRKGRAWVVDARGDRVELGGTLQNGVRQYIRYVDENGAGS